jgi:hypothetical protein
MKEFHKPHAVYLLEVAHRKIKMMTAKATRTLTTSPMDDGSVVVCAESRMRECKKVELARWWLRDTLGAAKSGTIILWAKNM